MIIPPIFTSSITKAKRFAVSAIVCGVPIFSAISTCYAAENFTTPAGDPETKEQRDARMAWWREARFGMFIHWGLYSVPAGIWDGQPSGGAGEWMMHDRKIPPADYQKLAANFNPVKFNADEWVRIAKESGVKYIVITAKHHEGFAMYHSKVDPFNIYDATPFKRDPLKELAEACQKQGMKLGFYYSQAQDWNHPGGAADGGGHWDPAQNGSMDEYIKNIAAPQVKEILSNYGPVSVLWWDTPCDMNVERARQFMPLLKPYPNLIVNNRMGCVAGDTETPEQFVPSTGFPGRDWETCMTINETWGFKTLDERWKSTKDLLRNLIDIASKGGNYLLNVGPTAEGVIPQPEVDRFKEIGAWLKVNGQAIYGTSASPFREIRWGRVTQAPGKLYLHVFDWPKNGRIVVPFANKVTSATLLARPGQALSTKSTDDGVEVTLPGDAPDPICSVVAVSYAGPLNLIRIPIEATIQLPADRAEIKGSHALLEGSRENQNIGAWTDSNDYIEWLVSFPKAGLYEVKLTYSCEEQFAGSTFTVEAGSNSLESTVESTGGFGNYRTESLGQIEVSAPGKSVVAIRPKQIANWALMNLRMVEFSISK